MNKGDVDHPDSVTYTHFQIPPTDPRFRQMAEPIARCSQLVFGYDPCWNEGHICDTCSTPERPVKFNYAENRETCDKGHALRDFWTVEAILEDMEDELARPHATCVVAKNGGEVVVGASWGFTLTPEEADRHLGLPGMQDALTAVYPSISRFIYLDEIFVLPSYQRRGIGTKLFQMRLAMFRKLGASPVTIFRTKRGGGKNSSVTYQWYTKKMRFHVIAEYGDKDDRVILGQHTRLIR